MKDYLNQFIRTVLLLTLIFGLQACGGGSSGKSDKYSIRANTSSITFANEFLQVSDDTFEVTINFEGNGVLVGYAPDAEPVGWLNFSTTNVDQNSATLIVQVVNAENIIADLYNTKIRLSTGDVEKVNLVHHDIDVSLLIWQLTTNRDSLSFKGVIGDSAIAAQTLTITSESENQWSAAVDADWLSLDTDNGEGSGEITLTPDISSFDSAQLYSANLTLTEKTTGDSKIIPIELGLDRHQLYAQRSALAFSQFSNIDVTQAKVAVANNTAQDINWQATADVNWLTVNANNSENLLTVNVNNDHGLADGLHQATITLTALDANNELDESVVSETIKVAFYKATTPSDNKVIESVSANSNALINSPFLPYFYVGQANHLLTYHLYSGELISTTAVSPENTLLERFVISPDGQHLIAQATEEVTNDDETTTDITHRYRIDLATNDVKLLDQASIEYDPIKYITVAGRDFIVTQTLEFADSELKRHFWDQENAYFTANVDQAATAQSLYALDLTDSSLKRYVATVNSFTSEMISVEQTHQYRPERLGEGQAISSFVVNNDDSEIYAISPTSEWISFDGQSFSDKGLLNNDDNTVTLALTKSSNGRAHYARFNQTDSFFIEIYDEAQQLINTVATGGLQPAGISLSSDDKRLLINAQTAEQIELINIEQLALSSNALSFDTTFGDTTIAEQTVTITGLSDNWSATSDQSWLLVSNDSNSDSISVSIDESKITTWGQLTGKVTIIDQETGAISTISVELAIDSVRLYASSPALSFNSLDTQTTLSHTVKVLTNGANQVNWQAASNVNWISLSADQVNHQLTVTALPGSVTNGLHFGEITLSALNSGQALSGTISVSLNKGADDAIELSVSDIEINSNGAVLDPLRPYFYVAQGHQIKVIDIISGEIVETISADVTDADLTDLVIHPDGSMLLTSNIEQYLDEQEQQQTRVNHYRVDLTDFSITKLAQDSVTINSNYRPQTIAMVDGMPLVMTEAQEFADINLVSQLWQVDTAFVSPVSYDVKGNDQLLSFNNATNTIKQYQLSFNTFANDKIAVKGIIDYQNNAFSNTINHLATNIDGTNLYSASVNSEWSVFDGSSYIDQGVLHGLPVISSIFLETDSQDNIYAYRFDLSNGFTLSKYNSDQQVQWSVIHTTGSINSYLSANYQRLISYDANSNQLNFDAIPN